MKKTKRDNKKTPKKEKKKIPKDKKFKDLSSKKVESILEELVLKLKSKKEDEESSPKKDSEDKTSSKIPDESFSPKLQIQNETGSPVLERIASEQPGTAFIPQARIGTPTRTTQEENSEINYDANPKDKKGPKYSSDSSQIYRKVERIDSQELGKDRETFPKTSPGELFVKQDYESGGESQTRERIWTAERVDESKLGKENIFEREKAKYENYKPRVDKG
ncbi:MAG: hypothetical protein KJ905_03180 [Nanoarchaeota archaeon]|nr:hypothetical protein [Nanoarchaeota archaeon]MBU1501751.1 hypothetical protein [Nanoarchaeota archaeon]MBU2458792.1 hypothetical protein [Nanoarchaeota archaeon]